MDKKLALINKIYPWYSGLSSDLIFYISINTIWLTTIKGFNPAQITFLSTISSLFAIFFQIPSLYIIKKIGNTKSIRLSSLFLLISSIMLTFCTNYISFAIANIFLEVALIFEMMSAILIKNNLEYQNKSDEYIKIRSKSSLIFSMSTAIITLFSGLLFNINDYLPMLLGILSCLFCFIVSFFIFDVEETTKDKIEEKRKTISIPIPQKTFLLILIYYGLSFGIVLIGLQNGKLLIQYELSKIFSIKNVATYLGVILFISRSIRVIINYVFPKVYKNINNKMSILLILSLIISSTFMLLGYYLNLNFYIKLAIITLGFSIFPSLKEPIKIYCQNLILNTFDKKYHKDSLIYLSLARHVGKFILSLFVSWFLLRYSIHYLYIIFIIILLPLIYISIKIVTKVKILNKSYNP